MKLKPHVAMYLIPVGILLLSIVFAGYMAVKAGQGFMEIDEDEWIIDLTLPLVITDEKTLMIFPDIEDDETYVLIDQGQSVDIRVEHTSNSFTTYPVEIRNSNGDPEGFTIEFTSLDDVDSDVLSITFEEAGTYYFDSEIQLDAIDFSELLGGDLIQNIIIGLMVGGAGFMISVAVFIVIAVKRSGSKKEYHKLRQAQIKERESQNQSIFTE